MALRLQVSNSLGQLSQQLCADLQAQQNGVFQPYYIVTQTEGMNNWLKLQLASNLGIAANCRFMSPNNFTYEIYATLGGRYVQPLTSENLCWLLFRLLDDADFRRQFPEVAEYYSRQAPDKDIKRMALAENIADLFDQYQIYRHRMIGEWNRSSLADVKAKEWQKYLWIKAQLVAGEKFPDKTAIGDYILRSLKDPALSQKLRQAMPAAHIFGISVTSAYHLEILQAVGNVIDITFHIVNPSPSIYWFDDRSEKQLLIMKKKGFADVDEVSAGNPLLASWGKLIRNTFGLLFEVDDLANAYEEVALTEPGTESLLQKIQHDIFLNSTASERNPVLEADLNDGTVTVNASFTPAREVEVLYNYLVGLIDRRKEDLSPRDIVVMVTDINTYAPYIRAVFNTAPHVFPYTIADESYTAGDTISNALKSILDMNAGNFKAEQVLQLLDSAWIRKRFGIADPDLIRKVVNRANIRFGIEGSKEDDTVYVSWKYGIERIMYGICMSGNEEYQSGDDTLYPLDMVEGAESFQVIRFCHFIDVLMTSISERQRPRTVAQWIVYVNGVLDNLVFNAEDVVEEDYTVLVKQLERYNTMSEVMDEKISYEVFCHSFLKTLGGASRSGSFASGGITFCSLIPMRSIPFRVVALLGMNYDKFPRRESPSGFNLMELNPQKGDRNVKDNDKHLFLETLLSAQQYFYLSYVGRSAKDNTVVPPSAVVDELLDYIEAGTEQLNVREALVTVQPLHGFNRRYQPGNGRLYSYLNNYREVPENELKASADETELSFDEISLPAFFSFFKNPFKSYYNRVLHIQYESEDVLLAETELFALDHLQKWSLKHEMVVADPSDLPALRTRMVKAGRLPLRNMAEVAIQQLEAEVADIRMLFKDCTGGMEESSIAIDLTVGNSKITGTLKNVYGNRLIALSWSKNETKYLIEAYLRYLLTRASGADVELHFISAVKESVFIAEPIAEVEAQQRLAALLELYKQGHRQIIPFYPDLHITPAKLLTLTPEEFVASVKKKTDNREYPCTDNYLMREYHGGFLRNSETFDHYQVAASLLLEPLPNLFPNYY